MSTNQPLNVLVLGYGFSAKIFHIPFISHTPGLKLHSILQRGTSPGNSAREDYKNTDVVVFGSWEEVEEFQRGAIVEGQGQRRRIDVLVVTAGNQVHGVFAKKGLELAGEGVHVVVEKPFTVGVKEAEEVLALAKKVGKVVTVYHNRRFDSDFLTLCKLLSPSPQARLRQITHLRSSYNRCVPAAPHKKAWKREIVLGNGVLYDLGSHLIDQVLHLFRTGLLGANNEGTQQHKHNGLPTRLLATLRDERGMYLPQSRDRDQWGQTWVDDGFDILLEYHPQDDQHQSEARPIITVHLTATSASPFSPQERFVARGTAQTGYVKFGHDTQEAQLLALLDRVPVTEIDPTSPTWYQALPESPEEGFGEEPESEWGQMSTLGLGQDGKASQWGVEKVKPEKGNYMGYYVNLEEALRKRNGGEEGGVVDVEVKAEQAIDVLRVIEAVGRSWREGRWVEVV